MTRLAVAAVAVIAVMSDCVTAHAQSSADLLVRIDQLENQVRQLTGMVEQAQFRNQQLEAALKRMQEDYEARFEAMSPRGGARPPGRTGANLPPSTANVASMAAPPITAAPTGRRSDAFDPAEHPNAPGAPRVLGSIPSGPSGVPDIAVEEPPARPVGAPLDLATMAAPNSVDPTHGQTGGPPPRNPNVVATLPPSQSPRDSFDLAYGYLLRKDYALAEETLRDFLKRYPSDRLTSEAQFWLGESMFQRQAYREAADAFLAMSKKYELSTKAPDALLRLGQSLAALNEKELACATFGEVVRKFPRASANVKQTVEREQKRGHC